MDLAREGRLFFSVKYINNGHVVPKLFVMAVCLVWELSFSGSCIISVLASLS